MLISFLLGLSFTLNILFVLVLIVVIKYKKKLNSFMGFNTDEIDDLNSIYEFFNDGDKK